MLRYAIVISCRPIKADFNISNNCLMHTVLHTGYSPGLGQTRT